MLVRSRIPNTSLHHQSNCRVTCVESHSTDSAQTRFCTNLNHTSQYAVDNRGPALSERLRRLQSCPQDERVRLISTVMALAFTSASTDAGGSANHPAISRAVLGL
jgi:hypothetical protein